MNHTVMSFSLENEMDVVLAHKRAVQLGQLTGLVPSDQTRFATAVSEIARNCVEYASEGEVSFSIKGRNQAFLIYACITDNGPGIPRINRYLSDRDRDASKRGVGIANSKRLVDTFEIKSNENGTTVTMGKEIPKDHPPINAIIAKGWQQYFKKEMPVSPYEEIKNRNIQLLEFMEQLRVKNMEMDLQLRENQRLSRVLEKKNEDLKQMAYLIAHDLKNPLNNITLSCEMFMEAESTKEREQFFEMVNKNAGRMLRIIEGVQKNIEQNQDLSVTAAKNNIGKIVQDLVEQFSPYLEKVDAEVVTKLEVEEVYYPQVYLFSIISNFLNNSIKYRAKRPLKIKIETRREQDKIFLLYSDNGTGIDIKENSNKLFKPFERFTKKGEGKGLGLSIVKHLITKNGGEISVDSSLGKGTSFTCYLKEYMPR